MPTTGICLFEVARAHHPIVQGFTADAEWSLQRSVRAGAVQSQVRDVSEMVKPWTCLRQAGDEAGHG